MDGWKTAWHCQSLKIRILLQMNMVLIVRTNAHTHHKKAKCKYMRSGINAFPADMSEELKIVWLNKLLPYGACKEYRGRIGCEGGIEFVTGKVFKGAGERGSSRQRRKAQMFNTAILIKRISINVRHALIPFSWF